MIRSAFIIPCVAVIASSQVFANDWKLEIVPTAVYPNRKVIDTKSGNSSFHVVLTNISKSDLSVWREWCSWGYFSLTFTGSLPDGKSFQISKKGRDWTKNYPDAYLVRPGQHFIWDVRFLPEIWDGFPSEWKNGEATIQAHFQQSKDSEPSPKTKGDDTIWFGKVSSDPLKVELYR